MKVLAIEKEAPGVQPGDFKPYLRAEALKIWELYQAGSIREMYFRHERPEAVLVLECAGAVEANQLLDSLPLVQQNLITFEVIPLVPYPGFMRLFLPEHTPAQRTAETQNGS